MFSEEAQVISHYLFTYQVSSFVTLNLMANPNWNLISESHKIKCKLDKYDDNTKNENPHRGDFFLFEIIFLMKKGLIRPIRKELED